MAGTSNGTTGRKRGRPKKNPEVVTEESVQQDLGITPSPTDDDLDEKHLTGLSIYDFALKKKLTSVFSNVVVAHPDIVLKRAAEVNDGNVALPMISMYRMNNPIKEGEINHFEAFHGRYARMDDCDSITLEMAVPIEIEYQVDIWAQYRTQADILFRELFFYLLREPNLEVNIPEFDASQVFALKYESMEQPTDYSSFEETYILHRYSITYKVPTARLLYRGKSAKLVHEIPVVMVPYSKMARK